MAWLDTPVSPFRRQVLRSERDPVEEPLTDEDICTESCVKHGGIEPCICDKGGTWEPGC